MSERSATRKALLGPTIEFAAKEVPFYRRTFGRRRELTSLPFLFKHDAIAHQRELLSSGKRGEAFTGVISSGTHHADGPLLQIPRTSEEAEATRAFFAEHIGRASRSKTRVLEVRAAHHGNRDVAPGRLLVSWTYSAQSLRLVEQMLSRHRIDVMVINAGALMPLTSWFLSRGVKPARFGLRTIGTTSFRLSPFWRELIEDVWTCEVRDNFSLSELPASAHECTQCGFHHWEAPPMVQEVVDPISRKPITRGTGVLVVTTLAPFVTRMPLIRYWTGDLVTIGPKCSRVDEAGFRPRGRLAQCVWSKEQFVSALDVSEFLEGRAEVARHAHPMETLGLIPPGECGAVKYELAQEKRSGVRIKVELRFDPMLFAKEAAAVGNALEKHLDVKGLTIEMLRPGSLKAQWVKF